MSKSRRFQPYPSANKTRLETLWTGVRECRKRIVRETTEGHASFVSRLNSIGLFITSKTIRLDDIIRKLDIIYNTIA